MNMATINNRPLPGMIMTQAERAQGRFMRGPDGHEQPGGGDNGGGNAGGGSQEGSGDGNNGGQGFKYESFWDGSDGGQSGTPGPRESADPSSQPSGSQQQQEQKPNAGQALMTSIQGLKFGSGIMTDDAISELAEGNSQKFHENMDSFGQAIVSNTIKLMMPILSQLRDQVQEGLRGEFKEGFQSREDASDLLAAIPSAKDPKVRPIVDSIFKRAMQVAKNDRSVAIGMTKDMLRIQSEVLGNDLGLPPRSAGDQDALIPSNVNWLDELAGR